MFKGMIQSLVVKTGKKDFERFLAAIDGASDREIGTLLYFAQKARIEMEESNGLPPFLLDPLAAGGQGRIQLLINRTIGRLQKEGAMSEAAFWMIWLHTLRAASTPELRVFGRRMWGILARGMPTAKELAAATDGADSHVHERLSTEVDAIPSGLEPRDETGREFMPGTPGEIAISLLGTKRTAEAARLEAERTAQAARLEAERTAEAARVVELGHARQVAVARSAEKESKPQRTDQQKLEDLMRQIESARSAKPSD